MNDKNRFEEIVLAALKNIRQDIADLRKNVSTLKTDVGWIKGKFEGRAETRHVAITAISIAVAIAAVVVAILK